jgi:hypothetical protein
LFIVLEAGQTQLRFQHVDRRAFSLYIVNPQLHRVQLHVAEEGDYAGGVQAWVDFQHRTTRRDALREMLDGPTKEMRPETAWLRRRVRGLVP